MEFNNPLPYDINISGSANGGYILRAGCCTCVFTDLKEMLAAIEEYANYPKAMEKKYNDSVKEQRPQVVEGPGTLTMGRTVSAPEPMNEVCECQDQCAPDRRY
jgi:hypothetical protein